MPCGQVIRRSLVSAGLALLAAAASVPLAATAHADSVSCSVPVAAGVLSPSGGNKASLSTTTVFTAQVTCVALDLENYEATLEVQANRNGGPTNCGSATLTRPSVKGQVLTLVVEGTCETLASDPNVNQTQYLAVRVTTTTGVDSGYVFYETT